jgi:hypothetical protein
VTTRDRAREVADQAASTLLNVQRDYHCKVISKGIEPPDVPKDEGGYYTVSFHMAGTRSAWVMQAKLRKRYPELDTKVVAVVDKDWKAEVRVKMKAGDTEDAQAD